MSNNEALTTTNQQLQKIESKLPEIDQVSAQLRDLVKRDDGSPSQAVKQAAAMQSLRELLTEDVMKPIMDLQNNNLGFKTDRPDNGYPVDTVRDVTISALGRGASMTLNRVNIIAGQCYLTREYFVEQLDAVLGRGNWFFKHGIPETQQGKRMIKDKKTGSYKQIETTVGAVVESEVQWKEGSKWKSQTLKHSIKGDSYATADAYYGKADRKCGAWLLAQVTGERVPEGEADDDAIDVTPQGKNENGDTGQKQEETSLHERLNNNGATKSTQSQSEQSSGEADQTPAETSGGTQSTKSGTKEEEQNENSGDKKQTATTGSQLGFHAAIGLLGVNEDELKAFLKARGNPSWKETPAPFKQKIIEEPEQVAQDIRKQQQTTQGANQ